MRDTLVAVDARLASLGLSFESVLSTGAQLLFVEIHVLELVTIATLAGIRCLHFSPYAFGEVHAPCLKFFTGIDSAQCPMWNFMQRCFNFSI